MDMPLFPGRKNSRQVEPQGGYSTSWREVKGEPPSLATRVDSAVGWAFPSWGVRRMAARQALGLMQKMTASTRGGFRGAKSTRTREDFFPGGGSADGDILPDLASMRERCRDLVRNNSLAHGMMDAIVSNVVGTGIKPQSQIDAQRLEIDESKAEGYQREFEQVWEDWVPYADASGRLDFYQLMRMAYQQQLENGDVVILPVRIPDRRSPSEWKLQVVEADRLQSPRNVDTAEWRGGVRIGEFGEPIEYSIRKAHPGDAGLVGAKGIMDYKNIPAYDDDRNPNVLHLMRQTRPGQNRGVPLFAPTLNHFFDLDAILEAELIAYKIAACTTMVIKSGAGGLSSLFGPPKTQPDGTQTNEMKPGQFVRLAQDEEMQAFNPNRPSNSFDPFIDRISRYVANATGYAYEVVARCFADMNYSTARTALLDSRKSFRIEQGDLSKGFSQPMYDLVIEDHFLRSNAAERGGFYGQRRRAWCKVQWIGDGWSWVDPEKEINAIVAGLNARIITWAEVIASQGGDWQMTFKQLAREIATLKELGIEVIGKPTSPTVATGTEGKSDERDAA